MSVKMSFRWFGEGNDTVSLRDIRQIPGIETIVWALHHKMPGEVWEKDEICAVRDQIVPFGFNMDVVESVNVHDDIKTGSGSRDLYIDHYIQTIRNLAEFGVQVICYNFMPVFDWTRTELYHPLEDGSTAFFYEKSRILDDPKEMAAYILRNQNGMTLPGWEPERIAGLDELFEKYRPVTKEKLWGNLQYFLEKLMPICHETGIRMAIHQDDPPWDIFGLPHLLTDEASVSRFLQMVDDPCNSLTLCAGTLSANPENDVADMVRRHSDRIAFAHIRNVRHYANGDFSEASVRDQCGETGILRIMKALYDSGYDGYIRPDHGRQIWGEQSRPGYGLYDRALSAMYLLGVWDTLESERNTD